MATKLTPVGSQFQVNQGVLGSLTDGINNGQALPDIAPLSDGRFVVVFQSSFAVCAIEKCVGLVTHFSKSDGRAARWW